MSTHDASPLLPSPESGASAGGRLVADALSTRDLTELEDGGRAVRQSEERLRQLADAMPQIVWVAEPDGRLEYLNRRWHETTGIPSNGFGPHDWVAAIHPDDVPAIERAWQRSREEGVPFECEYRLFDVRSAAYRWHLGRTTAERDSAGRVTRWFGTATDIHDRRLAEDALREADRHKSDFLAILSHELRNPLAPLQNAVAYLDRVAPPDEAQARARAVIERQVGHMARLVDDLLDVGRIARGKIDLRRSRCDFSAIVRQAVDDARPEAATAGVTLDCSLPAARTDVDGDPTRLRQIVSNLLHNALKFTPRGGRVGIAVRADGPYAELHVADTGVGIPPELLRRVFAPFFQADVRGASESGTEDRDGIPGGRTAGLGLGLALVRGLAEMHGGTASASSDGPGTGAEFVVRLPLLPAAQAMPIAPSPEPAAHAARLRVLVIEDNVDAAESLQLLLELGGHSVTVAHSGPGGIAAAERERPEVVICDIGLPGGTSGYDVARTLRASTGTRDAVMVALTGYGQEEHVQRTRSAGFDAHVVKPIDVDRFERVLADAISRRSAAP